MWAYCSVVGSSFGHSFTLFRDRPRRKPSKASSPGNSRTDGPPHPQKKSKSLAAGIGCLALAAAVLQIYHGYLAPTRQSSHPYVNRPDLGGWMLDPAPEQVLVPVGKVGGTVGSSSSSSSSGEDTSSFSSSYCDIDRVHASELDLATFEAKYRAPGRPVVIDGLIDSWPAFERWKRPKFKKRLGKRTVAVGDGANIVQTGGRSGAAAVTMAQYLDQMADATAKWKNQTKKKKENAASVLLLQGKGLSTGLFVAGEEGAADSTLMEEVGGGQREVGSVEGEDKDNEDEEEVYDLFNFDADFLDVMPELKEDFSVPELFWPWAGKGKRSVSQGVNGPHSGGRGRGRHPQEEEEDEDIASSPASSILSLGASRSGLPFHVHGETWLGLVFGLKRWFLYAPGEDSPPQVQRSTTLARPLMGSLAWLQKAYPAIRKAAAKAKVKAAATTTSASSSSPPAGNNNGRPGHGNSNPKKDKTKKLEEGGGHHHHNHNHNLLLECVQRPGEVVYLPRAWKHLTLNIGEAVGVGGQVPYDDAQRLSDSLAVLARNPNDLLSLKGAGLGLAQQGLSSSSSSSTDGARGGGQDDDDLSRAGRHALARSISYLTTALELSPAHPEIAMLAAEVMHLAGFSERAAATVAQCAQHYDVEFFFNESTVDDTKHGVAEGGCHRHNDNVQEGASQNGAETTTCEVAAEKSSSSSNSRGYRVAAGGAAVGISRAKLATAHLNFGRGFMAVDRPFEALKPLATALRLVPELADAHFTRGQALAMLAASEAEAAHRAGGGGGGGGDGAGGKPSRKKLSRVDTRSSCDKGSIISEDDQEESGSSITEQRQRSASEYASLALESLKTTQALSPRHPGISQEVRRLEAMVRALR